MSAPAPEPLPIILVPGLNCSARLYAECAHLVVVSDSGHLSTMEQPQAVNVALVEWLKS
jgi:pimeloyl-ACP methyl ester carboxylesterase